MNTKRVSIKKRLLSGILGVSIIHHSYHDCVLRPVVDKKPVLDFYSVFLKSGICKFEWIFRQNKAKNRRLAVGKSRFFNAVLAEKTPKLHVQDFRNTP